MNEWNQLLFHKWWMVDVGQEFKKTNKVFTFNPTRLEEVDCCCMLDWLAPTLKVSFESSLESAKV